METEKFQSRNIKDKGWFWTDNNALDKVSDLFGSNGIAIYSWLCRYSDQETQKCFPSISKLSKKCKMNRHTVIDILKCFQEEKIIEVIKKDGRPNIYQMLKVEKQAINETTSACRGTGASRSTGAPTSTTPVPVEALPPVPVEALEQESFNNNNLTIINKEHTSPQVNFMESFSALYENQTGQPFKSDKKHFILISNLIKKYGYESTVEKAKLLAIYCQQGEVWFAREGWSCFTPETLYTHWNRIVPILSDEQKKELKNKAARAKIAENERKTNELLKNSA